MKRLLPLFLLVAFLLSSCGGGLKPAAQVPTSNVATLEPLGTPGPKYGDVARSLIRDFSNMGSRVAGSSGETQAAQYITQVFQMTGYAPETQAFTFQGDGQAVNSSNVVALKKGTSSQEIIVGAHYDSSAAAPGADDNASGVGVMLEVARMISSQTTPYTIRFIAFGAGEKGQAGSYAYLNQMSQEEFENVIAMVDLDGLIAGDMAYALSDEGQQSSARDWALEWASGNGLDLKTVPNAVLADPQTGKGTSDYSPFRDAGIPFIYFQTANWSLGDKKGQVQVDTAYGDHGVIRNTKNDTLEYLDKTFPGRIDAHLNLFVSVLYNLLTQYELPLQ